MPTARGCRRQEAGSCGCRRRRGGKVKIYDFSGDTIEGDLVEAGGLDGRRS